jgi:cytochrome c-type biogenesis protein
MDSALIYSTSILTAFLGGVLALFAPCCIVSLGPTYLAGVMATSRRRLLDRTGVYAVGVAVILLPIVLGIGGIGVLLNRQHSTVFFVGGILMLVMGMSALAGKGWTLPIPMMRAPSVSASGSGGMFLLGVFSGIVSSCCAPVLGGVLVLSVSAGSVFHAFGLGVAYVVGMVFPLFLAALFWDRLRLASRGVFKGRTVALHIGGRMMRRRLPDLGAAVLFLAMGSLMIGLAVTGRGTYTPDFLRRLTIWGSARLAELAQVLTGVPEWVIAVGLIALISGMAALAWPRDQDWHIDQTVEQTSQPVPACHGVAVERDAEPVTH